MSRILKTVIVNGSLGKPSRTRSLLDSLHLQLGQALGQSAQAVRLDVRHIDLVDLVADIGPVLYKDALSAQARDALEAIETADFLIVGSPVFRGSLPGLLKHLFDLVDQHALQGTPVLLAATGGSPRHSLVLDHQLRPLFGFFSALTLPIGVYATPEDIQNGVVVSEALHKHIALAVDLAMPVLSALAHSQRSSQPALHALERQAA